MSESGQTRRFNVVRATSAFPPESLPQADSCTAGGFIRLPDRNSAGASADRTHRDLRADAQAGERPDEGSCRNLVNMPRQGNLSARCRSKGVRETAPILATHRRSASELA